jgi:multidrug efflux pump subunit AcrA (membrane-fusion protein)
MPAGDRNGSTTILGISFLVALAVAAGGGIYWWSQNHQTAPDIGAILHSVNRGQFELTVTERGEIEAFDVTEVRSLVKSKNTTGVAILRIVPEGTPVKVGDFLVELDSSALTSEGTLQKISVNTAQAGEIESHSNFETAKIAEREYLDGTYRQERQTIESEVFVAEENLNRYKEYYAYSQKLASKGYVNELQLEADRFAVEKANKDLAAAKTKLQVLDDYTKPKMLTTLQGATLIAQAKWEAARNSLKLEQDKLAEIEDQIAKCMILAPQAGIVKYAHENDRRGDQEFIVEEGAMIRERQAIILLPNADSMQVKLSINESLIQYVKPGMPASIMPVGTGDRVLHGRVQRVNQYPEPGGWRRANIKEYVSYVSVDESVPELRAGLTAAVTIECSRLPSVLQVPVQAVYAHGDKMYCFAYGDDNKWEAKQITPGPTNDKTIVVESGLNEGDRVALNPRGYVDRVKLPELSPEEKQRAVQIAPQSPFEDDSQADGLPSLRGGEMRGPGGRAGRGRGRGGPGGVRRGAPTPSTEESGAEQPGAGAAE